MTSLAEGDYRTEASFPLLSKTQEGDSSYREQMIPSFSDLNHVSLILPGTASLFTPKDGSAHACNTSFAVIKTFTTLFTGTITSLSTASSRGWSAFKSFSSIM